MLAISQYDKKNQTYSRGQGTTTERMTHNKPHDMEEKHYKKENQKTLWATLVSHWLGGRGGGWGGPEVFLCHTYKTLNSTSVITFFELN